MDLGTIIILLSITFNLILLLFVIKFQDRLGKLESKFEGGGYQPTDTVDTSNPPRQEIEDKDLNIRMEEDLRNAMSNLSITNIGKTLQKEEQEHLIAEMMKSDEESGLYDDVEPRVRIGNDGFGFDANSTITPKDIEKITQPQVTQSMDTTQMSIDFESPQKKSIEKNEEEADLKNEVEKKEEKIEPKPTLPPEPPPIGPTSPLPTLHKDYGVRKTY